MYMRKQSVNRQPLYDNKGEDTMIIKAKTRPGMRPGGSLRLGISRGNGMSVYAYHEIIAQTPEPLGVCNGQGLLIFNVNYPVR